MALSPPSIKHLLPVEKKKVMKFVNWCFEPSRPLGIISGLKETFNKRHMVERTNKAEIRSEGRSEKTGSCLENLWNEIQLKGLVS